MAVKAPANKKEKLARRWKSELESARKREKDWREEAHKVVDLYRGEDSRRNTFNILWANTEVLRPSLYSNPPKPDVRRRFRDSDPVGKAVSEVLERSLYVVVDHYESDMTFKADVLDGLVAGRGVSRIRYIPKISKEAIEENDEEDEALEAKDGPAEGPANEDVFEEALEYEQTWPEHVKWDDYAQGPGRFWAEVPWTGYRHSLTKDDVIDQFGKKAAEGIEFTNERDADPDHTRRENHSPADMEKVAEFWEIWDKTSGKVFFLHQKDEKILYPIASPKGEPPLKFRDFFPSAEPLRIVENPGSQLPIPMYRLYKNQAAELDKITERINKLVGALRLRALYDSTLTELPDVMNANDNDMIPIANAAKWRDVGGIEKAISWVPIQQAAQVLEALAQARDAAKQIIYEIIGISDIMRGSSMASETAAAQNLKAQFGSVRLKRMISEVQRYIRDTLRLCSEVVADKFEQQTLHIMTGLQFPTDAQKQQVQQHLALMAQQQAMASAPHPGLPPGAPQGGPPGAAPGPPPVPPEVQSMLAMPSWEDILKVLRDDPLREFRVDVETDSMIASTLQDDMSSLAQITTALTQTMQGLAPLVGEGALPMDAAKEIVLAIVRRAKMGNAVEDALEKMHQPPPKPPPPDPSVQVANIRAQSDQQIAQMNNQAIAAKEQAQAQADQHVEQAKALFEQQVSQKEAQFKAQLEQMDRDHQQQLKSAELQAQSMQKATELETTRQVADANNATKLAVAEVTAQHQAAMATQQQAHDASMQSMKQEHEKAMAPLMAKVPTEGGDGPAKVESETPTAVDYKTTEADGSYQDSMKELLPMMTQIHEHLTKPKTKRVIRDSGGQISGVSEGGTVRKVIRDKDGRIEGLE